MAVLQAYKDDDKVVAAPGTLMPWENEFPDSLNEVCKYIEMSSGLVFVHVAVQIVRSNACKNFPVVIFMCSGRGCRLLLPLLAGNCSSKSSSNSSNSSSSVHMRDVYRVACAWPGDAVGTLCQASVSLLSLSHTHTHRVSCR